MIVCEKCNNVYLNGDICPNCGEYNFNGKCEKNEISHDSRAKHEQEDQDR